MRWLVLAAAVMVLSGCGLPPIVTYTSYMADRIASQRRLDRQRGHGQAGDGRRSGCAQEGVTSRNRHLLTPMRCPLGRGRLS